MVAFDAAAQRVIDIRDYETNKPVRAVRVWTNTGQSDTTNYLGQCTIPSEFDTLTVSKPGYMPVKIPKALVKDTIMLISDINKLGEVIVYGTDYTKLIKDNIQKWAYQDPTEEALQHPKSANLLGFVAYLAQKGYHLLFPKKKKDAAPAETEDPILKAYRETQEEMQQKNATKEKP